MAHGRQSVIDRGALYTARELGVMTGKPRPVLVLQNDAANRIHSTITVCLVSSLLTGQSLFRFPVEPTPGNGLFHPSEVQVDRIFSYRRESLDARIGQLDRSEMDQVDRLLRRWLDL